MTTPTSTEASVDGRTTRWDAHRAARRAELVTATLRAIRLHGAGVGMDDIAQCAGTSKTVFYRHFGDRAGLYRAVADSVEARVFRGITQALEATGVDGPVPRPRHTKATDAEEAEARAVISAAIGAYLALVEVDPEVYQFVVAAPLVPAAERASADPAVVTDVISGRLAQLLADGFVEAGRSPEQSLTWGRAIVGMVRSVADQWLRSGAGASGADRNSLVADITELIWGGVSSPVAG